MEVQEIRPGDKNCCPKRKQKVQIHYEGFLSNGAKFDSSKDRGEVFTFKLGVREVIRGWDDCVMSMCKGQVIRATLSPEYAYGSLGVPGAIPPDSIVMFEIELVNYF